MDDSARQIRKRITGIILRAFIGVVFAAILIIATVIGIALSNSLNIPPFSLFARLEGYYAGNGSWDGVQLALATDNTGSALTLLDSNRRVVIDHGDSNPNSLGTPYQFASGDIVADLKVDGRIVGALVFDQKTAASQLGAFSTIFLPVGLISVFLAVLAAVLISLLSRRIVTPLAEVIAAARAVTAGKLDARVQVQGTQDLLILTDSFNQMADSLERNDHERRDLLADIAHELRTPISAIRGRLEGMLDGIYPADERHISQTLKSNYMLERLVEDLRLLTLAEARQLSFEQKEMDLKILANHSLEMFSAEAQEKNIQLELLPAPGDYIVTLDPQRTEQVVGNLIGNALHYVPAGGKVWITLERATQTVSLSINDNGPGIPEADLPYIFNRFWRKDKSRTRQSGGSGLGLAIAKQFIETQGGTISARNLAEGGLQVSITLKQRSY